MDDFLTRSVTPQAGSSNVPIVIDSPNHNPDPISIASSPASNRQAPSRSPSHSSPKIQPLNIAQDRPRRNLAPVNYEIPGHLPLEWIVAEREHYFPPYRRYTTRTPPPAPMYSPGLPDYLSPPMVYERVLQQLPDRAGEARIPQNRLETRGRPRMLTFRCVLIPRGPSRPRPSKRRRSPSLEPQAGSSNNQDRGEGPSRQRLRNDALQDVLADFAVENEELWTDASSLIPPGSRNEFDEIRRNQMEILANLEERLQERFHDSADPTTTPEGSPPPL
ncbi:hypothetical protein PSTG_12171 [Puccinia striiformis f. sp. tritici PST-78]|uniref:Uncharacterized protein n=1 Tax=Puccinia striiformis f. sp. tritici PST-78 TaxID=1165861 RepID=A0A0L0V5F8_9BASI|nr:hypothetical protein PSTG_12171 [Puccinia striiformis f. sp. tritici PST-78]